MNYEILQLSADSRYLQSGPLKIFLDDKTSEPDVFSSCSFIPRADFETSLVMVSYYGYEI